jgi:hypothetical protein
MPLTVEEVQQATIDANAKAKIWLEISNVLSTGGDPAVIDYIEIARLVNEFGFNGAREFFQNYAADMID